MTRPVGCIALTFWAGHEEADMAELTRRYIIMTMATEGPFDRTDPDTPFVLKPWKDPAALRALEAYRDHCYPELGEELGAWIAEISSGPVVRGGVGARNEQHMTTRVKSRVKPPSRKRAPVKVRRKVAGPKARKRKGRRSR
jgi:hypothetical protein